MSGRSPRWIGKNGNAVCSVELSGSASSLSAYVMIGSTKYSSATTLHLPVGTVITVVVSITGSSRSRITFNGTIFRSGGGVYSFVLENNTLLNFVIYKNDSNSYYSCDITTS